eukprot:m.169117 g.169117  ORF g.169117 m.169117 type:complete len:90 (-) comp14764_c0_seq6:482-751(-)
MSAPMQFGTGQCQSPLLTLCIATRDLPSVLQGSSTDWHTPNTCTNRSPPPVTSFSSPRPPCTALPSGRPTTSDASPSFASPLQSARTVG